MIDRRTQEYIRESVKAELGVFGADFAQLARNIESSVTAPHVLMRPKLSIDGNRWCALYGDNLQDGVAGFGDSPSLACSDFDTNWWKRRAAKGGGE